MSIISVDPEQIAKVLQILDISIEGVEVNRFLLKSVEQSQEPLSGFILCYRTKTKDIEGKSVVSPDTTLEISEIQLRSLKQIRGLEILGGPLNEGVSFDLSRNSILIIDDTTEVKEQRKRKREEDVSEEDVSEEDVREEYGSGFFASLNGKELAALLLRQVHPHCLNKEPDTKILDGYKALPEENKQVIKDKIRCVRESKRHRATIFREMMGVLGSPEMVPGAGLEPAQS
jgi:hypothetical protein